MDPAAMLTSLAANERLSPTQAGGKGSNLQRAMSLGLPAPPTLVIEPSICQDFLSLHAPALRIEDLLNTWAHDRELCRRHVRTLHEQLRDADAGNLEKLLERCDPLREWLPRGVIVRSSAVVEDGCRHSFAGCLKSFAPLHDLHTVGAAIRDCWLASFDVNVLAYMSRQRIGTLGGVAVLLQPYYTFEVSGVVFTKHPVTNDRSEVVVSAALGQCLQVVDGNECVTYTVARQLVSGHDDDACLSSVLREQPLLTPKQLRRLLSMALQLEKDYGAPMDIEWGLRGGEFVLLQTRPITT